jgi:hypothetical protein
MNHTNRNITADLFHPAPPTPALLQWAANIVDSYIPSPQFQSIIDLSSWVASGMIRKHCVWTLSLTVARQGFTAAIFAWIESPMDSLHIFIVPKLLQREYGRVNKHITFIGQFFDLHCLSFSHLWHLCFFYLLPFIRTTKLLDGTPWLDKSSKFLCPDWFAPRRNICMGCPDSIHQITHNHMYLF